MTSDAIEIRHVEISSPGTRSDGRRVFFVDYIEADGGRSGMWDGVDYLEARRAAGECAEGQFPVIDNVARVIV